MAVAGAPTARPSCSALSRVMMAAMVPPPGSVMLTSVLTAPGCKRATVPASWLRAEKRAPAASVTTMTDEALTSANAAAPTCKPRLSQLSRVMVATMCWPPMISSTTSSLTAPRCKAVTVPLNWLRALVCICIFRINKKSSARPWDWLLR